MDTDAYCREIEAYLCRRNAGHLVRVAGPAFEMVAGWAAKGIPLKVALRGIDRAVERREASRPGRRPLRIEFCEADVLDAFDEWRRAVGVGTAGGGGFGPAGPGEPGAEGSRAKQLPSLRAHLDRVVTRLTDCVAAGSLPEGLGCVVAQVLDELGAARSASRMLRGEARAALIARLQIIDTELLAAARASSPPELIDTLRREAEADLSAFRDRMASDQYARAIDAATLKLLRERFKLPEIAC